MTAMNDRTHRCAPAWTLVFAVALAAGCGSEAPPKPVTPAAPAAPAPTAQAPAAPTPAPSATPTTSAPSGAAAPIAAKPAEQTAAAASPSIAPTPGTVLRETELKDKPFVDARTLRTLAAQTSLVIVDRQSGWLRVSVAGQQGWVRLLHVSSAPAGSAKSQAELESFAKLATGRAGTGNVVATTGIRGLNEEQLQTAQANPEELRRLEGYGVSKEQAAEYARRHKLEARQVAHLPAPK